MKRENVVKHVKKKNRTLPEYHFGPLSVFIQDNISENINISSVFNDIVNIIPEHFLEQVDVIYIGKFSFLDEREMNATYSDGAIYISNVQDDEDDLKDDIIHEIAHAVEDKYGYNIYGDSSIEQEFLYKRKKLKNLLESEGYDIAGLDFMNIEYDEAFDNAMYDEVGYDALRLIAVDLFLAPYSVVSLREYFARGFEEYYLGNHTFLKTLCPYVYKKLLLLCNDKPEDDQYGM